VAKKTPLITGRSPCHPRVPPLRWASPMAAPTAGPAFPGSHNPGSYGSRSRLIREQISKLKRVREQQETQKTREETMLDQDAADFPSRREIQPPQALGEVWMRMRMKMWHRQLPLHFATSPASCKMPDFTHPGARHPQEGELEKYPTPPGILIRRKESSRCVTRTGSGASSPASSAPVQVPSQELARQPGCEETRSDSEEQSRRDPSPGAHVAPSVPVRGPQLSPARRRKPPPLHSERFSQT